VFNKKFGPGSILKGVLLDDKPSIIEKIKMLAKDVETEGKKQGYEKAANEYKEAFRSIELEYKEAKELIDSQKNSYGSESGLLIGKLTALEKQKKKLERQVEQKTKDVSAKYDIPIGDINMSFASNRLITTGLPSVSILGLIYSSLDLIYSYKEKKMWKAEQLGYSEAKKMYEEKIQRLKKNFYDLKKKGSAERQKLLGLISDLFNAIAEEQMKIADLKILLKGDK